MTPDQSKRHIDEIKGRSGDDLRNICAERAHWSAIKKEAEENEKACTQMMLPMMGKLGITNLTAYNKDGDPVKFIVTNGRNSTISRELLINQGIDPDVIEHCTKHSTFQSVQMRTVKNEG